MSVAVARAAGTPRRMGRAQGEAMAEGIGSALRFYAQLARGREGAMAAASAPFIDAARASVPDLVEEIAGLAEGAGISFEEAAILNCMEEVWTFEACTSMSHGAFLLHAEQWYAGHDSIGVVVAEPDGGPSFVSPTCAGFLPAVGMNASGFAQGIDSLAAGDDRIGTPRVAISRLVLGAANLTAAIAAATLPGRAGGYAHFLMSGERSVVVETTATTHNTIEGADAHTNHYFADPAVPVRPASHGSKARLERARDLLENAPPSSLEDCARLLADHDARAGSICVHEDGPEGSATVFAMACEVTTGRMLVSDGSPCLGRWNEFEVPGFVPRSARVG
ncbi:MAG: C45 family peptidase [Actinomycetota bacterium]|nr:C45 family peptidase [Actinomycetota bacterium]